MKNIENNQYILEELHTNFSFLNNKIYCKTHRNQIATTICNDCKTFCCLIDGCAQPHIYHQLDNLEYLINSQILPFLNNYLEIKNNILGKHNIQKNQIKIFKNNLKNFTIDEKKKIDDEFRNIINLLQNIYNIYMQEMNEFIETLNSKFDSLQQKAETMGSQNSTINDINNYINGLLSKSSSNDTFILSIAKDAKMLKDKINTLKSNVINYNFDNEIANIRLFAEKEYSKFEITQYFNKLTKKLNDDLTIFVENKNKRLEEIERESGRSSSSKIRKMRSVKGNSLIGDSLDKNLDIDLDIFVRHLGDTINKIRKDPNEALKIITEYIDMINCNNDPNETFISKPSAELNNKIENLMNYILNLIKIKFTLNPLEWDNDLSNSAEDYLKLSRGKLEKESDLKIHMKELIDNYYYNNYLNFNLFSFIGLPNINKIIVYILLNNSLYHLQTKHNIIFDSNYNIFGQCASIAENRPNHISLIINFAYYNKK